MEGAAKLPWMMVMLFVLLISNCPSSIHVILVSGKLNPVMFTNRVRVLPTVTFTVWSGEVMGMATLEEYVYINEVDFSSEVT